jgi:hypothetical protein
MRLLGAEEPPRFNAKKSIPTKPAGRLFSKPARVEVIYAPLYDVASEAPSSNVCNSPSLSAAVF